MSDALRKVANAIRADFGPDASEISVRIGRAEDSYRSPYMIGLMVYAADGDVRYPKLAVVQEYDLIDEQYPSGRAIDLKEDGVLLTGNEDAYTEEMADGAYIEALNERIFCEEERAPYSRINDLLLEGDIGLVPHGTWLNIVLDEALDVDAIQIDTEEAIAREIFSMDNELDDSYRLGEEDCAQLGRDVLKLVVSRLSPEEFAALKLAYGGQDE